MQGGLIIGAKCVLHGRCYVAFMVSEVWVNGSEPVTLACPGRVFGKPCLPLLEVVKGSGHLEMWVFLQFVCGNVKWNESGVVAEDKLPETSLE